MVIFILYNQGSDRIMMIVIRKGDVTNLQACLLRLIMEFKFNILFNMEMINGCCRLD